MSETDTYEVEEIGIGTESMWLRCLSCGRVWKVFQGTPRGSWRCPSEPHGDDK